MSEDLDPKSLSEIAARAKLDNALTLLPVEGKQRVLEKLRGEYFDKKPLTLSIEGNGDPRFKDASTSDPGRIKGVLDALPGLLSDDEKKRLRQQLDEQTRQYRSLELQQAETQDRIDRMKAIEVAYGNFLAGPMKLERPENSLHHKMQEAFEAGPDKKMSIDEAGLELLQAHTPWNSVAFVVEHDWASAFAEAKDFTDGDYPLPYDCTLFQFKVSGVPVLAMCKEEGRLLFVRINDYWLGGAIGPSEGTPGERLMRLIDSQIRAVCIALDAEVAVKETIRAPAALNHIRAKKGKPLLKEYHVVRLHRRPRAAPLDRGSDQEPSHHKRLHFVRGHWRHFTSHKTWIKWHLRGDPDLGFIEKHYLL